MGRRVQIGIILPSVNTIQEPELSRVVPEGVQLHFTRARLRGEDPDEFRRMEEEAPAAAELLADAGVDLIVFACTAASLYRGPGQDREIVGRIEARTGIRALTTSGAVLKAFGALGMRRIGLGSPYSDRMNRLEQGFFRGSGVEVLQMKGLGCRGGEMALVPPDEVTRTALAVNSPECDGIFLSCTNWRTLGIIEALEAELGKPVTSSNQATLWAALRMAGVKDPVPGCGRLLRQ
ncbi:MAG: aspartate/glutamate racemase family protein [Deltaproteobacteria bacterium]|nr:aspartate/glutamate racemase family protein [Deltaproteobacteria bacterium]